MTLWRRLAAAIGIAERATPAGTIDPRAELEAAYRRQVAALQVAQRGIDDVLTGEKRLELEAECLRSSASRAAETAAVAQRMDDDESVRRALGREALATRQRTRLLEEIESIRSARIGLERQAEVLRDAVETFRTELLTFETRYALAKAAARTALSHKSVSRS